MQSNIHEFTVPFGEAESAIDKALELTAEISTISPEAVKYTRELQDSLNALKSELEVLTTGLRGLGNSSYVINNITTEAYQLTQTDAGALLRTLSESPTSIVIPPDDIVSYPPGTIINLRQSGLGSLTITPFAGVKVNAPSDDLVLDFQNSGMALIRVAANEWDLIRAFPGINQETLEAYFADLTAKFEHLELLTNRTVDTDKDGVINNEDAFPFDPNESKDTDGDGIGDNADETPEGDPPPPNVPADPDDTVLNAEGVYVFPDQTQADLEA